jgi:hypothetical protein
VLFISYSSVFIAHLQEWDDNVPQHCYQTTKTSRPGDSHPVVDKIYVGITFAFTLSTLCIATIYALKSKSRQSTTHATIPATSDEQRRWFAELDLEPDSTRAAAEFKWQDASQLVQQILLNRDLLAWQMQDAVVRIALFQCPLHIYSIFALRSANEGFLDEGSTERDWGFGQIVSMVLLGTIVLTVSDGITGKLMLGDLVERDILMVIDIVEGGRARGKEVEMGIVSETNVENVAGKQSIVEHVTSQALGEDIAERWGK